MEYLVAFIFLMKNAARSSELMMIRDEGKLDISEKMKKYEIIGMKKGKTNW